MMEEGPLARFLRATEIDTRMLGMLAALFLIWAGFDLYGLFFKPGDGLLGGRDDVGLRGVDHHDAELGRLGHVDVV